MLQTESGRRLWGKSVLISAFLATAAGILALFGYIPSMLEDAARILGETIFDFIGLFGEGKSWNDTTATLAFGIGLTTFTLLIAPARVLVPKFWPEPPDILDSTLSRDDTYPDDPLKADAKLIGRDEEMSLLKRFAGPASGEKPSWLSVTGPHGVGKSRLANAWLRALRDTGWDVGYLSATAQHDVGAINEMRLRRKTAIVIDEFSSNTFGYECLHALLSKNQKIRILTLDQVSPKTPTRRDPNFSGLIASGKAGHLNLPPISHDTLKEISPGASDALIERADGRPLYVLLGEDPIASIDARLQECLSGRDEAAAAYLAFAALAGPVSNVDRQTVFGRAFSVRERMRLHGAEDRSLKGNIVPPLVPEPLANRAIIYWMSIMGDGGWENIAEEAARLNPASFYLRLVMLRFEGQIYAQQIQQLVKIFTVQSPGYLSDLKDRFEEDRKVASAPTDAGDFHAALSRLHQFSQVFHADREIQLAFAKAAVNAVNFYGDEQEFAPLEDWGMRLVKLAETPHWLEDQEIQLELAKAAVNAMNPYGTAQEFAPLEDWGMRLVKLAETPRWQKDQKIHLILAIAFGNAILRYGEAKEFAQLEDWGKRLVTLAETSSWQEDQEIQFALAKAVGNAVQCYGEEQKFAQLEDWGKQLITLAENPHWHEDQEIQLKLAKASVCAVTCYGTAQEFTQLEDWGMRLVTLAETPRWQEDQEIQFELAKVANNAVNYYGIAQEFAQLEDWGMRLVTLAEISRWLEDQDIQFALAAGAINAVLSTNGDQFTAWKSRLNRCARRNNGNLEIQRLIFDDGIVL